MTVGSISQYSIAPRPTAIPVTPTRKVKIAKSARGTSKRVMSANAAYGGFVPDRRDRASPDEAKQDAAARAPERCDVDAQRSSPPLPSPRGYGTHRSTTLLLTRRSHAQDAFRGGP